MSSNDLVTADFIERIHVETDDVSTEVFVTITTLASEQHCAGSDSQGREVITCDTVVFPTAKERPFAVRKATLIESPVLNSSLSV